MLANVKNLFRPVLPRIALLNVVALTYFQKIFLHSTNMAGNATADVSAVFITCPNNEEAKKLASEMVQKKMAACVNIIPSISSIYEWEGKINEDTEVLMMIKTKSDRVDDISAFIRENHSYDVAEVISTKIENGNEPYLQWIRDIVESKKN